MPTITRYHDSKMDKTCLSQKILQFQERKLYKYFKNNPSRSVKYELTRKEIVGREIKLELSATFQEWFSKCVSGSPKSHPRPTKLETGQGTAIVNCWDNLTSLASDPDACSSLRTTVLGGR